MKKIVHYADESKAVELYNKYKTALFNTPHAYREFCECIDWNSTSKDTKIEELEHSLRSKAGRENRKTQPVTTKNDMKTIFVNGLSEENSHKPVVYWSFNKKVKRLKEGCYRADLENWCTLSGGVLPIEGKSYSVLLTGKKRHCIKKIDIAFDFPEVIPAVTHQSKTDISDSSKKDWEDRLLQSIKNQKVKSTELSVLRSKFNLNQQASQIIDWVGDLPVIKISSPLSNECWNAAREKVNFKGDQNSITDVTNSVLGNLGEIGSYLFFQAIKECFNINITLTVPNLSVHTGGDINDIKIGGIPVHIKWRKNPQHFASDKGNPDFDVKSHQKNDYFIVCSGHLPSEGGTSYNLKICKAHLGLNEISLLEFIQATFGILK